MIVSSEKAKKSMPILSNCTLKNLGLSYLEAKLSFEEGYSERVNLDQLETMCCSV